MDNVDEPGFFQGLHLDDAGLSKTNNAPSSHNHCPAPVRWRQDHFGHQRNNPASTFLTTASVRLRLAICSLVPKTEQIVGGIFSGGTFRKVGTVEADPSCDQTKKAKARVVECSEGEDSTQALALAAYAAHRYPSGKFAYDDLQRSLVPKNEQAYWHDVGDQVFDQMLG